MPYISIFKVNQATDELEVTVAPNAGSNLTTVTLWTEDTYKDYAQSLDFSSKIGDSSVSNTFTISATEISETTLDGIYFIEILDDSSPGGPCATCDNTSLGVATDFSRFSLCVAEYLCAMADCDGCDPALNKAITLKFYIDGLRNQLQMGNFTTAIQFWNNLDRACSSCSSCTSVLTAVQRAGLGFQTLGGELILY